MDIFGMVMGGLMIGQGIINYRSAKKMAGIQERINNIRRKTNIEKTEEVFKRNYGKLAGEFVMNMFDIKNQQKKSQTDIISNAQQQTLNNIDVAGSSSLGIMQSALSDEVATSFNTIIAEQLVKSEDMYFNLIAQQHKINLAHSQNKMGIDLNREQEKQNAIKEVIGGAMKMGMSAFGGNTGLANTVAQGTNSSTFKLKTNSIMDTMNTMGLNNSSTINTTNNTNTGNTRNLGLAFSNYKFYSNNK